MKKYRTHERLFEDQSSSSLQPILSSSSAGAGMQFEPPNPPFNHESRRASSTSTLQGSLSPFSSPNRSRVPSPTPFEPGLTSKGSNVSLSVNYVPAKFSGPGVGPRRRHRSSKPKGDLSPGGGVIPKMGGGVDAFRSGEARIGNTQDDEDDDGSQWTQGKNGHQKLKWNRFKWTLFVANVLLTLYSFAALIICLMTWFNVWHHADIIRVGNFDELVLSTFAASVGIFTCVIGWSGILLNNRCFLAIYTFMLWITFIFLLIPGYLTYKRRTFNLEGKVNAQWSQDLGQEGRLRIQNQLNCCGYFSPFVEATISQTCYARSILPGCKLAYINFERGLLKTWYTVAFALVPIHIGVIVAGLLCSNHVTYRFGKGMMPKAYRLSMTSMALIMENYASQLAEQYGDEIATDVLTRSRSNLQLSAMPTVPYTSPPGKGQPHTKSGGTRYDALRDKTPSEENTPGVI
ncbi:hypothetical protein D9613_009710 [Agrocybe pediades]|uniref:Tetraspanin Tsp2 n=1 Tax=Agrocybe pediades TaxID=84607 RepID=A0A8H4QWI3_9AGAR|nr:hypothetical protein D9613_009710 [Agrocybe pediades]